MRAVLALMVAVLLSGCATSQSVVADKMNPNQPFSSAALVVHGGTSADMDAVIQKALTTNGLPVKATIPQGVPAPGYVDVTVTYTAKWRWDFSMQLSRLTVDFYDAKTSTRLGSGTWENSAVNASQDINKAAVAVINDVLRRIRPIQPVPKHY